MNFFHKVHKEQKHKSSWFPSCNSAHYPRANHHSVLALPCLGGCNSLNLFRMLDTRSAAAPEELDCLGMSAC